MGHTNPVDKDSDGIIRNLRKYFDDVAWTTQEGSTWTDTELEVSPTRLNNLYAYREHARNRHFLKKKGTYFLDSGCGARPYGVYAIGFRNHVCVDFSMTGLRGARENFEGKAYYVQADIRRLPFKSGTFDGLCSPYVIYHIPGKDNQEAAIKELYRTLKTGCSGVIIYDNPNHLGIRLRKLVGRSSPLRSLIALMRTKNRGTSGPAEPDSIHEAKKARDELLHYEPLASSIIEQFIPRERAISVKTHSLLTEPAKKAWLKDNLLWNIILRFLLLCESLTGGLLSPLAAVWCIVIRKRV